MALAISAGLSQMREQDERTAGGYGKLTLFALYSGLLVMTLVICFLQLTTVQALRAIGMLLLSGAGITFMLMARGMAGRTNKQAQLLIGLLVAAAVVVLAFVIRADSDTVRFRTGHVRGDDASAPAPSSPTRWSST